MRSVASLAKYETGDRSIRRREPQLPPDETRARIRALVDSTSSLSLIFNRSTDQRVPSMLDGILCFIVHRLCERQNGDGRNFVKPFSARSPSRASRPPLHGSVHTARAFGHRPVDTLS
jgi:hypothetical protein